MARATDGRPHSNRPGDFVLSKVVKLQEQYLKDHSAAKAALAMLRRASARDPGTVWEVGEYLIPDLYLSNRDTDIWNDDAGEPTRSDSAIHIAMTTYAWLQQSNQRKKMHVSGRSLGEAMRILAEVPGGIGRDKAWGRLAKLAQAESLDGFRWQLRGIVSLLRSGETGFDIAKFSDDVYFWQDKSHRTRVVRVWSRAFFNTRSSPKASENGKTSSEGPDGE